jgi:hypothetical protein
MVASALYFVVAVLKMKRYWQKNADAIYGDDDIGAL